MRSQSVRLHALLLGGLLAMVSTAIVIAQDPQALPPPVGAGSSGSIDALRGDVGLNTEPEAQPMARVENADRLRQRAYPMQPPTIPHSIDGYQIDKNSNRCMLCHARANADTFQAPPVGVTHYMDRDSQILATVSARRYFCLQCHVVQTDAPLRVKSDFVDIDTLLRAGQEN